jgi:hypothetical protein
MKRTARALGLSLLLAAPLAMSQPSMARETNVRGVQSWEQAWQQSQHHFPALQIIGFDDRVSQSAQQEWDAFHGSKFTYWDAKVLAFFWNQDVAEAKQVIGRKLLWGGSNVTDLEVALADARANALDQVDELRLYGDSFVYEDAVALAEFWGEPDAYEAKLRIERKLILGQDAIVLADLAEATKTAQPPIAPDYLGNLVGSRWTYNYNGRDLQFAFGQTSIDNFSNGWWKGISWQPSGHNELRLWNSQSRKAMTLTFDSPDSYTGHDWDGSPVSGARIASRPTTGPVKPPAKLPTVLKVINLQAGEILSSQFNVTGQGVPGSEVLVKVEYPKQDFLSKLGGVMLRFQAKGTVSADGNFSVSVDARQVPRGEPMTITLSDTAKSPVITIATERGSD